MKNQVQGKMASTRKKCAPTPTFVSRNQLVLKGFESPFDKRLNPENRWVVLANLIPWDEICNIYLKAVPKKDTGRPGLNPRIVLGFSAFSCEMFLKLNEFFVRTTFTFIAVFPFLICYSSPTSIVNWKGFYKL